MIDARRLLIFRGVARAGSLSAAARELGWTQPAVTQHLNRLEREAGAPLVLRGPGGVTLTEAGAVLLTRADAVAAELHAAGEELAALADARRGRVRLLAFPSAAATLVPQALAALAERHPGIEVSLAEHEPPEAAAALRRGDADLAIVFGHDGAPQDVVGRPGLEWRRLTREPVRLVLPPGHAPPPTTPGSPPLAAYSEETWIGGCPRCRAHLLDRCRAAGFEPRLRHSTDDYVAVQHLVARGLGVTLLPASALHAYRHPEVQVLDHPGFGVREIGLAHRPGAEQVPATAVVAAALAAADGSA